MNNPTSILGQAKRRIDAAGKDEGMMRRARGKVIWMNAIRRGVCVLALVLLFLTVGVGGGPDRDFSTAQVEVVPTEITTAMLSREPNLDGWNTGVAQVTSLARFKAH